jgi:hypothetical protein
MASALFDELAGATLKGPFPSTNEVRADSLWRDSTALIYVLRRAGCPFCRKFAVELMKRKGDFESTGARLIVIVSQEQGAEAFSLVSWKGGEVYIDEAERFKHRLGSRLSDHAHLLEPKVMYSAVEAAIAYGASFDDINNKSSLLGGELVVTRDQGIVFEYRETARFAHANVDTLLDECRKATDGEQCVGQCEA